MAFFDRVTSSVQRFTRRVGGGGAQTGSTRHPLDDESDTDCPQQTLSESSPMEKRIHRETSSFRIPKTDEWRRRENEMNEAFRRKMENMRQKWQAEKSKELDTQAATLRKKHEAELESAVKNKDRELKLLRTQLQKSQEQLLGRSRSGPLMNSASQDSIKSSRSQDYSHSRGRTSAEVANMRDQVSELQQTIRRNENESKRREAELRTIREQHEAEIQRMARDAQRHIKALLEELQQKERRIEKLERQLRTNENQLSIAKDEFNSLRNRNRQEKSTTSVERQAQLSSVETPTQQVADMKLASSTSSMSASRLGLAPPNTISKDEYDKDKQRWQQRMNELEATLKRSEESNAELAQGKAELIKKNKELEKVKKSLEEFNKKLSDRQRVLNLETRHLEQKLKEAQDETIRATQAYETVTLECNRLKEKRYNPDRDEELEKLRQQNLEYCKCIAALKQTILEKDRRLEVLQQKLRRSKRCRATIVGIERSEDENSRSVNDLDFTASSMSLDTINEDYAEATKEELELSYRQLANEHVELQNICSSLMRQASADGSLDDNQDLRNRLQEALQKIVQLEKSNACTTVLGVDATWAQEKLKYASLIRAMGEKIEQLEATQDRLQHELGTAREENELLEFQVLEMEHSHSEDLSLCSSSMTTSRCNKSLCDRSVSTSEDEGHFSMDLSMEDNSMRDLPLEELKIRLTILKHRKELRPDERGVIAQVKEMWENLQNEHLQCGSKLIEAEMRLRETETQMKAQLEELQLEKLELSAKDKKKLKAKEVQRELESLQESFAKLQEENAALKGELDGLRSEASQLRSAYTTCVESEERERTAVESLRQQLDDMAISRKAEIEILEQASRHQAQNLAAMRAKIAELEKEIDQLNQENRSLSNELSEHRQLFGVTNLQTEELERLRKVNSEYQESLAEYKKLESCWDDQRQDLERKYSDVKTKFKEAMKLIKEYELNISKYVERLKEAAKEKEEAVKIRTLQEQRISELEHQLELLNKSSKPSRDDFIAYKEVEEQLKAMLREKSNELEEKCVVERRLLDEKTKLQKQLQHVKSYSSQLESQFEMQIQIVQALKTQVLDLQKSAQLRDEKFNELERSIDATKVKQHLDIAHRLITSLLPILKVDQYDRILCCQMAASTAHSGFADQQAGYLEQLGQDVWNNISVAADSKLDESFDFHKACVKLHSVRSALSKMETGGAVDAMGKLSSAMLSYCERLSDLNSKVEDLEKTALLYKEEADKANARAEMLQRQCRDALVQPMGVLHPFSSTEPVGSLVKQESATGMIRGGRSENEHEKLSDTLDRMYRDLKAIYEKAHSGDAETLNAFRLRMSQLVLGNTSATEEDNCLRTISPLELCGSGTESELCDRSPLLSRKRRSTDGGGSGSFRSSSSEESDLKRVTASERKTKLGDDVGANLSLPFNVRLAADLRNGRYLVCWSPPEVLGTIQGYRVYVKDVMRKYVASAHCTKAVVECGMENEWVHINVRSVAGVAESTGVFIDVDRSKKFVQSAMLYDVGGSKSGIRRQYVSHDDNEDDEECSEV